MPKQNESKPEQSNVPREISRGDVASLDHSFFATRIGAALTVPFENIENITLTLAEVSDLKESKRQERFAVVFRGPLAVPLAQGSYVVELEEIGAFDLFLVPVGMDEQGYFYEAVFNRLLSENAE
jgi:hypothetical protein